MGPHTNLFLVLVLCLGQTIHMQDGVLPKPCIWAELRPVIRQGQLVTIVCQSPAGADRFRLEEKDRRSVHNDQKSMSQHGSQGTEARFHIDALSDGSARGYYCLYHKGSSWSERSDLLELKVTDEDVSMLTSGAPRVISSTPGTCTKPPSMAGLSPEHLYVLVGICVVSLLCLLLLALLLVHHQRQKKSGPPSSKGEEPRPQERLSPTADLTESPADVATTVDALPEENGDMHSPSPAAGDPQEVTYAQLDQRALTRRAALTESPQPTEPTAESSMYAALPRHCLQDHLASVPRDTDVTLAKAGSGHLEDFPIKLSPSRKSSTHFSWRQDLNFGDPYSTCRRFTNQVAPPTTNQLGEAHL